VNFDRVADIYDETRGIPETVVAQVSDRIVSATGAGTDTRFLEIGIGTGRIALPLIQAGYEFTGVDISEKMLDRLRDKAVEKPNLHLRLANIADLPFDDNSFDVAIAVHVLHLVPEWLQALSEVQRVLKPGGYFVLGDDQSPPESPFADLRRQWRAIVRELGGELRPRYGAWEDVIAELTERNWPIAIYRACRWEQAGASPLDAIEKLSRRTFSDSWSVSDDVMETTRGRLLEWAREQFDDLQAPEQRKLDFFLAVARRP